MFKMLSTLWHMLTVMFNAGGRLANALDIMAAEAENAAQGYVEEAKLERAAALAAKKKALASVE